MKALNAIKKIAAVGIGVAMLGATAMGGLAYTLGDYPQPFASSNGVNSTIVLGSGNGASVTDVIGAVNIVAGLAGTGAGKVTFQTPESVVVGAQPIYSNLGSGNTNVFPIQGQTVAYTPLTKDNMTVTSFLDSNKNLGQGSLVEHFNINFTPGVDTSQNCPTTNDININKFVYTYNYSNSNIQNYLNTASTSDFKYPINLLGSTYYVYFPKNGAALSNLNTSGYTAGSTLQLQRGGNQVLVDSNQTINLATYGYPGYYLKIGAIMGGTGSTGSVGMQLMKGTDVNSLSAVNDIQLVNTGNTATFQDPNNSNLNIQVTVNNIGSLTTQGAYNAYISFTSGTLNVGDFFDSNLKMWKLTSLELSNATSSTPYVKVGVTYNGAGSSAAQRMYSCKLYNNELYMGNSLDVLGHYSLSFPQLTNPATSPVSFTYDTQNHRVTMATSGNGYFLYQNGGTHLKSVTLQLNENSTTQNLNLTNTTYYSVTDVNGNTYSSGTSDTNAPAYIKTSTLYTTPLYFYVDGSDINTDNFKVLLNSSSNSLVLQSNNNRLDGKTVDDSIRLDNDWSTSSVNYPGDVGFGTTTGLLETGLGQSGLVSVGQTTYYGIKVNQYTGNNVQISVPDDAVRYAVYLGAASGASSQKSTVSYASGDTLGSALPAGSKVLSVGGTPLKVGIAKLDTSVLASDSQLNQNNYIVVGGPCINEAAAMLLKGTTQQYCGNQSGIAPNTALLQLFTRGDHTALLVAGYDAPQTTLASEILGNYGKYKSQLDNKTKLVISGTTTSDVSFQ